MLKNYSFQENFDDLRHVFVARTGTMRAQVKGCRTGWLSNTPSRTGFHILRPGQFGQHAVIIGPVLRSLKIVMETVPDVTGPLGHQDLAAGPDIHEFRLR